MYDLAFDVIKNLYRAKVLNSVMLIGSWCMYFYQYYFSAEDYVSAIRTLDMDFLVPIPMRTDENVSVPDLLGKMGFIMSFSGTKGYVRFEHPDLIVEFLVPERGRATDTPYEIPQLGVNAVSLRYLDFLVEHAMDVAVDGVTIRMPHPAAYALHKCIIFNRRKKQDKKDRDLEGALRVFRELIRHGQEGEITRVFATMHARWQRTVVRNLSAAHVDDVVALLKNE